MTKWFVKSTVFSIATVLFFVACNPPKGGRERVGAAPVTGSAEITDAQIKSTTASPAEIADLANKLKDAGVSEDPKELEDKAKKLLAEREQNNRYSRMLLQSHIVYKEVLNTILAPVGKEEIPVGSEKYKAQTSNDQSVFLLARELFKKQVNESGLNHTLLSKACETKESVIVEVDESKEDLKIQVKDCTKKDAEAVDALTITKDKNSMKLEFNANVFRKAIGPLGVYHSGTKAGATGSINCSVTMGETDIESLSCKNGEMVKDIVLVNSNSQSNDKKAVLAAFEVLNITEINNIEKRKVEAKLNFVESQNVAFADKEILLKTTLNGRLSENSSHEITLELATKTAQILDQERQAPVVAAVTPVESCDVSQELSACADVEKIKIEKQAKVAGESEVEAEAATESEPEAVQPLEIDVKNKTIEPVKAAALDAVTLQNVPEASEETTETPASNAPSKAAPPAVEDTEEGA